MTLLTYESHYRGLTRFFKLIGNYESLLMLCDKHPKNCSSMRVESCIMYMWYKFRPVTTVLTNLAGEPVNDVTSVLIHYSGTWNDPGKCRQFAGALYCILCAFHSQVGHNICHTSHNTTHCANLPHECNIGLQQTAYIFQGHSRSQNSK